MLQISYNLCLKLITSLDVNATLPKVLNDMAKNIETLFDVEKCIVLRLAGKEMIDGREYRIPHDECFMEDIREEMRPIIVNDIGKDKNL